MYLLYCDETNFEKVSGDFFVYGGVTVAPKAAASLDKSIETIRAKLTVPRDYVLKFNPGPQNFSHQQFIEFKQAVIQSAIDHGCKLLVSLCLHDIATSSDEARRFGINTACYHFDCFLNRLKAPGLVLIDRFSDDQIDNQLRKRLAVGLTGKLPYSSEIRIENIVGYHYTAIGQSHFCSMVDVVLGSLRFAINAFTRDLKDHAQSSRRLIQLLSPMFFRENSDKVHEISLWFSPKDVRKPAYRTRYAALVRFLSESGVTPSQAV